MRGERTARTQSSGRLLKLHGRPAGRQHRRAGDRAAAWAGGRAGDSAGGRGACGARGAARAACAGGAVRWGGAGGTAGAGGWAGARRRGRREWARRRALVGAALAGWLYAALTDMHYQCCCVSVGTASSRGQAGLRGEVGLRATLRGWVCAAWHTALPPAVPADRKIASAVMRLDLGGMSGPSAAAINSLDDLTTGRHQWTTAAAIGTDYESLSDFPPRAKSPTRLEARVQGRIC